MKRALGHDFFRSIWQTKSRFIAIFAIVFIGVAFFSGIKVTCDDIKLTANDFFDKSVMADFKVLSTYGVTDGDIEAFAAQENVQTAEAGYYADVIVNKGESEEVAVRVYSLPETLNKLELIEGRLPQKSGECVVEKNEDTPSDYVIGGKLKFTAGDDDTEYADMLSCDAFTIVGIINSPMYISTDRDSTDIGNGTINSYIFVPAEDFSLEEYTVLYLRMANARMDAFSDEYKDAIAADKAAMETLAAERGDIRLDEIKSDAYAELDEPREDIAEAKKTIADETSDAQKKIDDGIADLEDGQATLDRERVDAYAKMDDAQAEIDENKQKLNDSETELLQNKSKVDSGMIEVNAALLELEANQSALDSAKAEAEAGFAAGLAQIDAQEQAIQNDPSLTDEQKAAAIAQLEAQRQAIEAQKADAQAQFAAQQVQLDAGKATAEATKAQLLTAEGDVTSGLRQINEGKEKITSAQAELDSQRAEAEGKFADAQGEIDDGWAEIDDAKTELDEKVADAQKEIDDGQAEIDDAIRDIEELEHPEWYVLERDEFPGYATLRDDAEKIDNLSKVLPVFFILIAFLVCLTTMTRMVDEERTQIGTMKALGYGAGSIMAKYLLYAIIASTGGSIVGVIFGYSVFPPVFFSAYSMLYILPSLITPYYTELSAALIGVSVAAMAGATYYAVRLSLIEQPASLMRPKAPQAGKKVLLERLKIWERFSFKQKITIRNLFRNKKRMIMTVVGIAGGTALMLTGFGLQNAFAAIVPKQYGEVMLYDTIVVMNDDITQAQKEKLMSSVDGIDGVKESDILYMEEGTATKTDTSAYIMVMERTEDLPRYINLYDRDTGEGITLDNSGAVISEKLADVLGIAEGDGFAYLIGDEEKQITVTEVTRNYAMNYIYVTPQYYEEVFGKTPDYNSLFLNLTDGTNKDDVAAKISATENVKGASFKEDSHNTFLKSINNMNYIVFVIILAAGFLAFVVLYNLVNINVGERIRELATLKVLGFSDGETTQYIYRENLISTIIGIILGLALGILLERYVIAEVEVDRILFIKDINALSFVWSALLTFVFAMVVNILLHFKLKKINMAESLKSIE